MSKAAGKRGSYGEAKIEDIERAITDPETAPDGIILADEFAADPAIPSKPFIRENLSYNTTGPNTGQGSVNTSIGGMPYTDIGGAVFNHPLRAQIVYKKNQFQFNASTPDVANYNCIFSRNNGVEVGTYLFGATSPGTFLSFAYYKQVSAVVGSSVNWSPHGAYMYPALGDADDGSTNVRGIWIDGNTVNNPNWTFTASVNPTGTDIYLQVYRYDGTRYIPYITGGTPQYLHLTTAGSFIAPTIANPGYYALRVTDNTVLTNTPTITALGLYELSDCFAHLTIPGIEQFRDIASEFRILGNTFRLEVETQISNRGGQIAASSMRRTYDFVTTFVDSGGGSPVNGTAKTMIQNIIAQDGSTEGRADNGFFGFRRPKHPKEFKVKPTFLYDGFGMRNTYGYPIVPVEDYFVWAASFPASGVAATTLTNQLTGHRWAYINYNRKDTSGWMSELLPNTTWDQVKSAVKRLMYVPQFFENPFHWSALKAFIGRWGPRVKKFLNIAAAPAGLIANAAFPGSGAAVTGGLNIAGNVAGALAGV